MEVGAAVITKQEVQSFALALPEAHEMEHWGKPSYRIGSKIFAVVQEDGVTLTVKTTGEDRIIYTDMDSAAYSIPESFSNMNYMHIHMTNADPREVKGLLVKAWSSIAPKRAIKAYNELGLSF